MSKYNKAYYENNKEKYMNANKKWRENSGKNNYIANREKHLQAMKRYRDKARLDAITHYGGKCECCGETHIEFLAIDHINGGGHQHQKSINGLAIGIWLRKNKYPAGFRVLCHNCNLSLGHYGYCPHNN